ncbi:MAG: hypothetical protein OXU30_02905, partial [Gammaproteobacteria bacterium]|nr:hypothetical protein [Gammaproteobacteria bacterium]
MMIRILSIKHFILFTVLLVFSACAPEQSETQSPQQTADIIFLGDNIITMDDNGATAVAVMGDRIIAVGDRTAIEAMQGDGTRLIELGERALVPGFIDAHGH